MNIILTKQISVAAMIFAFGSKNKSQKVIDTYYAKSFFAPCDIAIDTVFGQMHFKSTLIAN